MNKKAAIFCFCLLITLISFAECYHDNDDEMNISGQEMNVSYENGYPISGFIENKGQYPSDVLYALVYKDGSLQFKRSSIVMISFADNEEIEVIEINFPGSRSIEPVGENVFRCRANFISDSNLENWIVGARTYGKVIFKDLWDGIDLVYSISQDSLKYELCLSQFSNIKDIRIEVDGAADLDVIDDDLLIRTQAGIDILDENLKVLYADGDEEIPNSRFILFENDQYGFEIDEWDVSRPIIIDPYIRSTLFGHTGKEWMSDIETASDGHIVMSGKIRSSISYPGKTYGRSPTGDNIALIIVKMDPLLNDLDFITFIGDSPNIEPTSMVLDDQDNIYLTGICFYQNFPTTPGAYDREFNGNDDGFLLKVSPDGADLHFSTLFGGVENDDPSGISLGMDGSIYILGETRSPDFPTTDGAYDREVTMIWEKVFITRFNGNGSRILNSTLFGNGSAVRVYDGDIETDADGNILITGHTGWESFPVTEDTPSQYTLGESMFLTRFSKDLKKVLDSCRMGGNYSDRGCEIELDPEGNIIVAGTSDFMEIHHDHEILDTYYDGTNSFKDIFVMKFDHNITEIKFSTLIGGNSSDKIGSMLVDGSGNIHIVGYTDSKGFPHVNWSRDGIYGTNGLNGKGDGLYFMLHADGSHLLDSFYLGGVKYDSINDLSSTVEEDLYFLGYTRSEDFPTTSGTYRTEFIDIYSSFITLYSNRTILPTPGMLDLDLSVDGADLSWTAPKISGNLSLQGYLVYRGKDLSNMILIDEVVNATKYLDEDIQMGNAIYYYIKANFSTGISGPSNLVIANDLSPPIISPLDGLSPIVPFTSLQISTEVTDNLGIENVWLIYSFDGMEETEIRINWSSNNSYKCSIPIHLADNITLKIHAVDIWGNTASVGPYKYVIKKTGEYWWGSIDRDENGSCGIPFNVEVSLNYPEYHESGVVEYWFADSEKEQVEMDKAEDRFSAYIQIPADRSGEVHYLIRLTAVDGSTNDTVVYQIWIQDDTPPWIKKVQDQEVEPGENITIELDFGDNIAVGNITISHEAFKLIGMNFTGSLDTPGEYNITITIEDISGNTESTSFLIVIEELQEQDDNGPSKIEGMTMVMILGIIIGIILLCVLVLIVIFIIMRREGGISEE